SVIEDLRTAFGKADLCPDPLDLVQGIRHIRCTVCAAHSRDLHDFSSDHAAFQLLFRYFPTAGAASACRAADALGAVFLRFHNIGNSAADQSRENDQYNKICHKSSPSCLTSSSGQSITSVHHC